MRLLHYSALFIIVSILSITVPFACWSSKPVSLEDVIIREIDSSFKKEDNRWVGTVNVTLLNFASKKITIPWIDLQLINVSYSDGRTDLVNKTETVSFNDTVAIGNYWKKSVIFWGPNRPGSNPIRVFLQIKVRVAEANGFLVLDLEARPSS